MAKQKKVYDPTRYSWTRLTHRDGHVTAALRRLPGRAAALWALVVPAARAAHRTADPRLAEGFEVALAHLTVPGRFDREIIRAWMREVLTGGLSAAARATDPAGRVATCAYSSLYRALNATVTTAWPEAAGQASLAARHATQAACHAAGGPDTGSGVGAEAAEWKRLQILLRRCLGYDRAAFDPAWRTADAEAIARGLLATGDLGTLPLLADALEEAGCTAAAHLKAMRDSPAGHSPADWAVWNLVLPAVELRATEAAGPPTPVADEGVPVA